MISSRRHFFRQAAAAVGGSLAVGGVRAPELPGAQCAPIAGRLVRCIVPFSPGGGYDIYARLLEPFLEAHLGVDIMVENRPGAAGLVGTRGLHEAAPDGLTLGLLNATGLLTATLDDPSLSLNPAEDFTILGRVARTPTIWATNARSGFRTVEDVLAAAATRSIVVGITEVASNNFISVAVGAHLLGFQVEYVAGFAGTRESSLALARGDTDLSSFTFGSVRDRIDSGDLVPILQIADRRVSAHRSLQGVPLLGGDGGLAARRSIQLRRDTSEAMTIVDALTSFLRPGRVVAAPPGLPDALARCVDHHLQEAMTDADFEAAAARARRPLDVAAAAPARAEIRAAADAAPKLLRIAREAIRGIRG